MQHRMLEHENVYAVTLRFPGLMVGSGWLIVVTVNIGLSRLTWLTKSVMELMTND